MMKILFCSFIFCLFIVSAEHSGRRRNCHDLWYYQNIRQSGNYEIDVDDDGPLAPITVECDMGDGRDSHEVLTVVHHDAEDSTLISGFEKPSHIRNVTYTSATEEHLTVLIDSSFSCQQYTKVLYKGTPFDFGNHDKVKRWWVGRNWKDQYYWDGAETNSENCGCSPDCYPTSRNSTCNSDANLQEKWLMDVGLLMDSSSLPVSQLRFEGTKAMHYELGPLICRVEGFRDVFMGIFRPPYQFTTPGYDDGIYPPPFYRYTWTIKASKYEATELIFPEYDVVHYASYNVIPECKNVVTLRAQEGNSKPVVFTRQTSPPYYVSGGSELVMNLTLTTCNQDRHLRRRKGFKASIRSAVCPGTYVGTGENKGITYIRSICGVIASKEYPFPYNYDFSSHMSNEYTHSWILQVFRNYVIRLEFNDFDIPADPGAKNCTPESGILWIYDGIGTSSERFIGGFCNLNREGILYSTSNYMTLVFSTRWKKTGNGRGFQAVFSAEQQKHEIKTCTEALGMESGEISNMQMFATSNENEENYFLRNGRLHSSSGWCAAIQDSAKEFTVDFWELVTVNGIVLQGLKGASKRTAVKRFYVSFSNNSLVWRFEEEPIGRQKIYVCDECESDNYTNDLEIRFNFLKPVSTQRVQIKILEYYERPCLRLEILGCKKEDVPQLSLRLGSELRDSNILEGHDIYFECNIRANPRVSETGWRFEGHELVTNISAGVIVSNENLVLQNVQRNNRGKYSCTATNSEGQGESNQVYLRVQYSPVCKQNQETTYAAKLHYPVQIPCEVEADPGDVAFRWEFKNSSGNFKLVPTYSSGTKSFINYIPKSESDFGTLQCWGSNSVGSQRVPCLFFVIPADT